MVGCDIVKEFLNQLDPDDVPFEFIAAASIKDINGQDVTLKGEQLKMLMTNHPDYAFVKDARIFINLQKVIKAVSLEVDYIYERVDLLFRFSEEN